MKKFAISSFILASTGMAIPFAHSVNLGNPEWSQDLMVKTCVDRVSYAVEGKSMPGHKSTLSVLRATAIRSSEDSFVCLVVADQLKDQRGVTTIDRVAYSATVWPAQPAAKTKYTFSQIPLH